MTETRTVKLSIRRTFGWQETSVEVREDGYVLDALEAAFKIDPNLLFRHACHHASCGSCGIRVNGRERLACITPLAEVNLPGKTIKIEPLRNFPLLGDLLVDFGSFMQRMDEIDLPAVRGVELTSELEQPEAEMLLEGRKDAAGYTRLENCIECGLCISACPISGSDADYLGPAILAAAGRLVSEPRGHQLDSALAIVNDPHGVWRCHGVFECTEVCPAGVDPAGEIMGLRRRFLLRTPTCNNPMDEV